MSNLLMVIVMIAIVAWTFYGFVWLVDAMMMSFNAYNVKELLFINAFKKANIFGKVLCVLTFIIMFFWIALYFVAVGLFYMFTAVVNSLKKLGKLS